MQTICRSAIDTYINICLQNTSYILKSSSSFPLLFPTNLSYPFHISSKPTFTTQFLHHILSNVSNLTFYIAALFQKRQCCLVFVGSRVNYLYIYRITTLTHNIFPNVHTLAM